MSTLALVLIIILAFFIISAVIIVAVSILSGKNRKHSEIHFSGGASLDDGRLFSDNNFFKGLSGTLGDTVVVNENRRQTSNFGFSITIKNLSDGKSRSLLVNGQLVLGRIEDKGVYAVNDKSVSRQHCRLTVQNGRLFLSDLGSANHTYLNGRQIFENVEIHGGDIIKIGSTMLEIYFNN